MGKGYWNKMLKVDLSSGKITTEYLDDLFMRKYIGGSSLATKILYDEVKPGTKGLAVENKIIFALGPYQGTGTPGSGKWAVVAKSPLTNTFAVSTAGAIWGQQLKKAGYDALVIEGQAEKPVFLSINNDDVRIESAIEFWGKDAVETTGLIKEKIGNKNAGVLTIGPAGENLVSIACIVADEHSFAGRCGLGAVMGSKRLKAIAAYGTKKVEISNEEEFKVLRENAVAKLRKSAQEVWRKYGTSAFVESSAETGDFPLKNWSGDVWPKYKQLSGDEMIRVLNAKPWPCYSCPVGCHRHISVENPQGYPGLKLEGAGPEYESLGLLGGNCLVDDLVGVAIANDMCNRLGIDTISAGSFVAFVMDCYEKGILTKTDLDGLEARWGDATVLCELINQIGNRKGFGAIFANGICEAATRIGKGAEELTVEVKNLDLPAHDPRTYFSLGLNYATGTRGACHLRGYPHFGEGTTDPAIRHNTLTKRFDMEGQAMVAIRYQDWCVLQDSLVICMFMYSVGLGADEHVDLLNAITGWDITASELFTTAERAWNMQRLINIGDGITRADDRLPKKMFIPAKEGFRAGKAPYDFDKYLDEYYYNRGWDSNGIPTPEKLKELGIII